MSKVESLYNSQKIFDELFGTVEVAIETNDYYYNPDRVYYCFYVEVKSSVDVVAEEVTAYTTSIRGEIPETIERIFRSAIPPQLVTMSSEIELLQVDANELLLSDNWNTDYPDMLFDAIEDEIRSLLVEDEHGRITHYPLKIRDIYLAEY
ncbi:hypothetical protein [Aquibacillus sediminis]|uniref:hypothetical protein n=1 Tax=Aquibacillus sediminis TaxID=2574734 RepID=UPI001109FE46|nr:hypothetical protein [Aquibacillus sediminis]